MSLIKQLAKETAIYGVSSILVRLLPFAILTPFYTRYLEEGAFGMFTDAYVWIAFFNVLFTYRMETTFFRFGSRNKEAIDPAFSTASISIFGSTALLLVLVFSLHGTLTTAFFKGETYGSLTSLLLFIVGVDTLTALPFARLRLEKRPLRFAWLKTISILANIGLVFFFLLVCPLFIDWGWTFWARVYQPGQPIFYILLSNLLASIITLILLLPIYRKINLRFDGQMWRKMMVYAVPLVLVGLAGVINQLAGNTMIKELASNDYQLNFEYEGIYSAVAKIAVFMNLFTQAFNFAAEPFFFSHAQRADAKEQYANVARLFAMVGAAAFLGVWLYLDMVKYFIGPKYHDHIMIAPILLMAYLFLGLYYNFSIWYKLTDQTKYGGYIAIGGAAITITLNGVLIPNPDISFYGPAWTALVCYAFMAFSAYALGQRKYPIPYPVGRILMHILGAVLVFLGSWWLKERITHWSIVGQLGVNTLIFLTYLGVVYRAEKPFFSTLFR